MKFSYTKIPWNNLFDDSFIAEKWFCIKIAFACVFLGMLHSNLILFSSTPYPTGLYALIDSRFLQSSVVKLGIEVLGATLLIFYLFEKQMIWVTGLLFIIGMFIFSVKESNGIFGGEGLLSLCFLGQWIAYAFYQNNKDGRLHYSRIQFAIQFIAAVYTLAAISKWYHTGLHWIADTESFALSIQKTFDFRYVTNGDIADHQKGAIIANLIASHRHITQGLMASVLLLETFAGLMLINRKWAFYYGILLTCMHIGILLTMTIFFTAISVPMMIFCINPLFLLYTISNNFFVFARQSLQKK